METMPDQPKPNHLRTGLVIVVVLLVLAVGLYLAFTRLLIPRITQILGTNAHLGLIAYVGTDGNIYTVAPDSKKPTSITRDANLNPASGSPGRVYQYPTWAPNGSSLAFMGFTSTDQGATHSSLYTASSDGKKRVEAFSSQQTTPFYLFWSPNSQYVTFLGNAAGGTDLELRMAPAAGGESKLIGTGQPYYWDWSPDNQAIVVHTGGAASDNPDARLALLKLDGTIQKRELDLKPGAFQAPAWSPKGDELALSSETDSGEEDLILVGKDGTIETTLARLKGPMAFAWSPSGDRLAYTTPVPGDTIGLLKRLVLVDPSRPDSAKNVVQTSLVAFFWSPDGQKIVYFSISTENPGQSSMIALQTNPPLSLQVQVYDLASGDTRKRGTFSPTDSFQQVLPFFDQYQHSGTIWSPDSKNLVLAGLDATGNPYIFIVAADSGKTQKIADGDFAFWSWK